MQVTAAEIHRVIDINKKRSNEMRIGRNLLIAMYAVFCVFTANAQTDSTRKVLQACDQIEATDPALRVASGAICVFQIDGFLEGYRRGADHGVGVALINDPQASMTLKGVEDLFSRAASVRAKARCIPEGYSVEKVIPVWRAFVLRNPQRLEQPYTVTLSEALEDIYCGH